MTVTIDVIPESGWQLAEWVGPVFDIDGNTAKIKMESSQNILVMMEEIPPSPEEIAKKRADEEAKKGGEQQLTKPEKPSVTTPPVFERIGLGGDSIFLESAGCNNEYFERVTLQEGDRVDLSVTAARMVTIVVKSPHAGRKTVGRSDKFHEISYHAKSDGKHILIIVADYAQQPYLQCNKRASHVEYEYAVYRPTMN